MDWIQGVSQQPLEGNRDLPELTAVDAESDNAAESPANQKYLK